MRMRDASDTTTYLKIAGIVLMVLLAIIFLATEVFHKAPWYDLSGRFHDQYSCYSYQVADTVTISTSSSGSGSSSSKKNSYFGSKSSKNSGSSSSGTYISIPTGTYHTETDCVYK